MFNFFRFIFDFFSFKKSKKTPLLENPLLENSFLENHFLENYNHNKCVLCSNSIVIEEFIVKKNSSIYKFCSEKCYLYWLKNRAFILGN